MGSETFRDSVEPPDVLCLGDSDGGGNPSSWTAVWSLANSAAKQRDRENRDHARGHNSLIPGPPDTTLLSPLTGTKHQADRGQREQGPPRPTLAPATFKVKEGDLGPCAGSDQWEPARSPCSPPPTFFTTRCHLGSKFPLCFSAHHKKSLSVIKGC